MDNGYDVEVMHKARAFLKATTQLQQSESAVKSAQIENLKAGAELEKAFKDLLIAPLSEVPERYVHVDGKTLRITGGGVYVIEVIGLGANTALDVENLAKALHEAGREAVARNCVVRRDVPNKGFIEWNDLDMPAREGRFIQARWLLERFIFSSR